MLTDVEVVTTVEVLGKAPVTALFVAVTVI